MPIVGRYRIQNVFNERLLSSLAEEANHWLDTKDSSDGKAVSRDKIGEFFEYAVIKEEVAQGVLTTALYYGLDDNVVDFYMEFDFQQKNSSFQPAEYQLLRPKLVKSVIDIDNEWRYGQDIVRTSYFPVRESAVSLVELIMNQDRRLPIIVVSESELSRRIAEKLAYDVCGLANVFLISDDVSWILTRDLGKEFSCFGGYVRVYWPFMERESSPFRHQLINVDKMMTWEQGPISSVSKVVKNLLFNASINAISTPKPLTDYLSQKRDEASNKDLQKLQRLVHSLSEDISAYDDLLESVAKIELDLSRYSEENTELRRENQNLRENAKHFYANPIGPEENSVIVTSIDTDSEAALRTVVDNSLKEIAEFVELLPGAINAVGDMDQDAGPPSKVREYLIILMDLARQLNKGSLGVNQLQWLHDRGMKVSGESDTVRNNKDAMKKRTWKGFDGEDVEMEMHLKPNDSTSPDKCLRIYFKYNPTRKKIGVGYIGRHLIEF